MARMLTPTILFSFLNAVERLQRKFPDGDHSEGAQFSLAAMNTIVLAHENPAVIPYRLVDPRVLLFGPGRSMWRLFQATQLQAEFMCQSGTDVTEHDVIVAYNEVDDDDVDSVIFTDGNVSPAAQREIRKMPIFSSVSSPAHWIVERMDPTSYTAHVAGESNSAIIELDPEVFRCDHVKKIWDIVPR